MSQPYLTTAKMLPLPKLVLIKCIVDPDIAQFKWEDLVEKTRLAVMVSEQRNRRKIYHTPHSSFSIQPVIGDAKASCLLPPTDFIFYRNNMFTSSIIKKQNH